MSKSKKNIGTAGTTGAEGTGSVDLGPAKAHFLVSLGTWIGRSIFVVALAVPIRMAGPPIRDLAGQDTRVNVTMTLSVVWGATATIGWAVSARKRGQQAAELRRLRERREVEEGRIAANNVPVEKRV